MASPARVILFLALAFAGLLAIQAFRNCNARRNSRLRRRLARCDMRMESFFLVQDTQSKCRAGRSSVSCFQRIYTACPRALSPRARLRTLHVQQLMDTICAPGGGATGDRCPHNVTEQLNECFGGLTAFSTSPPASRLETCPLALSSLNCLEMLMEGCPNNNEVQSLQRLLNLPVFKESLQSFCNDSNESEET